MSRIQIVLVITFLFQQVAISQTNQERQFLQKVGVLDSF
jgi:hypothetical protein